MTCYDHAFPGTVLEPQMVGRITSRVDAQLVNTACTGQGVKCAHTGSKMESGAETIMVSHRSQWREKKWARRYKRRAQEEMRLSGIALPDTMTSGRPWSFTNQFDFPKRTAAAHSVLD